MQADLRALVTLGQAVYDAADALNFALAHAQGKEQYHTTTVQQHQVVGRSWPRPELSVLFRLSGVDTAGALQQNVWELTDALNTACGAAWQRGLFVALQTQEYHQIGWTHPAHRVQVAVLLDTRRLEWQDRKPT